MVVDDIEQKVAITTSRETFVVSFCSAIACVVGGFLTPHGNRENGHNQRIRMCGRTARRTCYCALREKTVQKSGAEFSEMCRNLKLFTGNKSAHWALSIDVKSNRFLIVLRKKLVLF